MRWHRWGRGAAVAAGALLLASAVSAQQLAQAIAQRQQVNEEGEASQKRIDEVSEQTDTLTTEYRSALKQIEALRAYNQQMNELIVSQNEEIASFEGQIDDVDVIGRGVTPLMLRMIDSLQAFIDLDVPFLMKERQERMKSLRELMNRSDVTNAEKYRRILEAYQIENEYGRTIEAYRATVEREGAETTVDFLRIGRIALVYQTLDGSQGGVWSQEKRDWLPLDSSLRNSIQQGLRVARKQTAPELIRVPLPVPPKGGQG
jgi:FtsZ-binding cell division protein ZapB